MNILNIILVIFFICFATGCGSTKIDSLTITKEGEIILDGFSNQEILEAKKKAIKSETDVVIMRRK